jgi:hypothetical protein
MNIHFNIVHGFLEGQTSDQAGLHSLGEELKRTWPAATVVEHTQDKFDTYPFQPAGTFECDLGNSWGLSAILRRLDKNPQQRLPLAIGLDGVPNEFNEPKQTLDKKGWRRRTNLGHLLYFRETESILKGTAIKPENMALGSFQRDDGNGFMNYEYGFASEYVLDWDPRTGPLGDFFAHFQILTENLWVKQIMLERIARAIAGHGAV